MSIEAVFFDMDGTLVDTEPYWWACERELMAEYDYAWSEADQQHCLGGPLTRVGSYMQKIAKVESSEYFMDQLILRVQRAFENGLNFMPGAYELMLSLYEAGIPLALVSASPRVLVDATLASLEKNFFPVSVSSNDVKENKPFPEPYLTAAIALGVDITHSIVLEDSMTGITSAQASGAMVVAVPHLITVPPHPRTISISTLVDVNLDSIYKQLQERISL